jgi:hypothetical protein
VNSKQRWVERIQQEYEEEKPRDVYALKHRTYFSDKYNYYYHVIVTVYSKNTIIDLYKTKQKRILQAPIWIKVLASLLDTNEDEPIYDSVSISNSYLVPEAVKAIITDYEMPLYNRWMAEEQERAGHLKINYEEELRKKRKHVSNPSMNPEQEVEAAPMTYEINDYFDTGEEKTEEQIFYDNLKETAQTKGVSEESLKQLKQNRDKILKFEQRKAQ